MKQHTQIIATIGPATASENVIRDLIAAGMDIARLNFSWGTHEEHARYIQLVREQAVAAGKHVLILQDLSGPRVAEDGGHTFDGGASVITEKDKHDLAFGIAHGVDIVAQSFVASAEDVQELASLVRSLGGTARVVAKIERAEALAAIDAIIAASDGIMIARGDLGDNIPFSSLPAAEMDILERSNRASKPVIVATEMMTSMISSPRPTRAETVDCYAAVLWGADAIMLSNETAVGAHPMRAVQAMRAIADEAESRKAGVFHLF